MNDTTAPAFVPGIFPSMPAAQYFSVEALSASGCKKLLQSPAHYKLMRDQPSTPTPAMQFGTVVHAGVLEPDSFDRVVAIAPELDKRTKDGRAKWDFFSAANMDKIVISNDDYTRALACIEAVRAHPAAAELLRGAECETSVFWTDGQYNVPCKARFDARSHGGIIDLKTCADASKDAFSRAIATYGYAIQAAHYMSACEHVYSETPRFFCFIAVESEPPYGVATYALGSASIRSGAHLVDIALQRYAKALASNEWPSYPDTIETIDLPGWALKHRI